MFFVSSPSSSSSSLSSPSSPPSSMASAITLSPSLPPTNQPQKPSPYACDTLPAPQNLRFARGYRHASRSPSPFPSPIAEDDVPTSTFDVPIVEDNQIVKEPEPVASTSTFKAEELERALPQPPARKLCVRHQRMADQGISLHLQKSLDALPLEDRESVNSIWSTFSSSSHPRRAMILQGLLTMCCFSQLSMLTEQLTNLIRLDPFTVLPREISLKILGHLDATSLCRAAQVNRHWRDLADDDILWRSICEQHIGQKCHKCGWGLPMLERRRKMRIPLSPPPEGLPSIKRDLEDIAAEPRPLKRQRSEGLEIPIAHLDALSVHSSPAASALRSRSMTPSLTGRRISPPSSSLSLQSSSARTITRPWKDVYSERLTIERNWRRGRCTVQTLEGHTDGVMCMQFSETLQHPSFPVLITGSYDRTARVWNLEKGQEVQCLRGHSRAIRALQFDAAKLITGSMDHTLRVWNWRTGRCVRILEGHSDGVVSLNFDSNVLASGSVDSTIKIWNFRTGECFTLRGHRDWVNSVQLWDSRPDAVESANATLDATLISGATETSSLPTLDPGKMLFSASDDGTIRLWDLTLRTCVRQFTGHMGQVQSIKLLKLDPSCDEDSSPSQDDTLTPSPSASAAIVPSHSLSSTIPVYPSFSNAAPSSPLSGDGSAIMPSCIVDVHPPSATLSSYSPPVPSDTIYGPPNKKNPSAVLISGSLDNTIRVWDIETGKAVTTMFGHIEGVWAVASDKLRLVSGSHDRTIKVWSREEGRCTATLVGHRGAVTCLALGDDKIVSGSDDGDVRIWSFSC